MICRLHNDTNDMEGYTASNENTGPYCCIQQGILLVIQSHRIANGFRLPCTMGVSQLLRHLTTMYLHRSLIGCTNVQKLLQNFHLILDQPINHSSREFLLPRISFLTKREEFDKIIRSIASHRPTYSSLTFTSPGLKSANALALHSRVLFII